MVFSLIVHWNRTKINFNFSRRVLHGFFRYIQLKQLFQKHELKFVAPSKYGVTKFIWPTLEIIEVDNYLTNFSPFYFLIIPRFLMPIINQLLFLNKWTVMLANSTSFHYNFLYVTDCRNVMQSDKCFDHYRQGGCCCINQLSW